MKLIKLFFVNLFIVSTLWSCKYENEYWLAPDLNIVSFANQKIKYDILADGSQYIKIGVSNAGRLPGNEMKVNFELAPELMYDNAFFPDTTLRKKYKILDPSYYSFQTDNLNTITIPAGKNIGDIVCKFNYDLIKKDSLAFTYTYCLPIKLVVPSKGQRPASFPDSIGNFKQVILIRFLDESHGFYNVVGSYVQTRTGKSDTIVNYKSEKLSLNERTLTTVKNGKLVLNGIANFEADANSKDRLNFEINPNNTFTFYSTPGSIRVVGKTNGEYNFSNKDKKYFALKYNYVLGGDTYNVTDTLFFRNQEKISVDNKF